MEPIWPTGRTFEAVLASGESPMHVRHFHPASTMFRIRILALVAVLIGLLTSTAHAHHEPGHPFYLGFALAFAAADPSCDYYGHNCDGTDTGFKFYGGKRLHENLGIEIAYLDLGKLRKKDGNRTTVAESEGINLSLLGIIPTGEVGYFYGKAGVMASESTITRSDKSETRKSDEDSTDITYGLGYAFTFGGIYDFRIEFERLNELSDDFISGGESITSLNLGGTIYFD